MSSWNSRPALSGLKCETVELTRSSENFRSIFSTHLALLGGIN